MLMLNGVSYRVKVLLHVWTPPRRSSDDRMSRANFCRVSRFPGNYALRTLQGGPVLFLILSFVLLALVRLEEDVVLDDLGVELAEDGPVVVDEADKVAGDLRELPLTQGQPRGDLKQEKHFD